jgi:serine protease
LTATGLTNDSGQLPARRADVINLSLGDEAPCSNTEADVFRQVAQAGVLVVASGGNSPSSAARSPASCPGVISVGAVTAAGTRAAYSAFGNAIALLAPGGDMNVDVNADRLPDGVYSTHATRSGGRIVPSYEFLQGTSMAAPHVAGVLALMKSVKPSLTPNDVRSLLEAGLLTNDLGPPGFDENGWGLIDAAKALQAANGTVPSAPVVRLDPVALEFGNALEELSFELRNAGVGLLTVSSARSNVPWATVAAGNVNSAGLGCYRVRVSRAGLPRGILSGAIELETSAGLRRIPISLANLQYNVAPRPGRVYVRFLDAETGAVVRSEPFDPSRENAEFRLYDVPLGRYTVVVGTDLNNDGNLCDVGELCGSFPAGALPDSITYSGVLRDLVLRLALTTVSR